MLGYPGGYFSPDNSVSRQDLVTILFRYAQFKNSGVTAPNTDLSGYSDFKQLGSYAQAPMRWAVGNQIVSGTSSTTLSPKGTATRAQLVQMLYRWLYKSSWELPFIPNG